MVDFQCFILGFTGLGDHARPIFFACRELLRRVPCFRSWQSEHPGHAMEGQDRKAQWLHASWRPLPTTGTTGARTASRHARRRRKDQQGVSCAPIGRNAPLPRTCTKQMTQLSSWRSMRPRSTCFRRAIEYDYKEIHEVDGALAVGLKVND